MLDNGITTRRHAFAHDARRASKHPEPQIFPRSFGGINNHHFRSTTFELDNLHQKPTKGIGKSNGQLWTFLERGRRRWWACCIF